MIFALLFIFLLGGFFVTVLATTVISISPVMYVAMIFMGMIIQSIGVIILFTRAHKTGLIHLLEFANPDKINWLFVRNDNTITITPALREIEGFETAPKLKDAVIKHVKSYRFFDHNIRIVKEGQHFSTDLDMCIYAKFLKLKGIQNILQARKMNVNKEYKRIDV